MVGRGQEPPTLLTSQSDFLVRTFRTFLQAFWDLDTLKQSQHGALCYQIDYVPRAQSRPFPPPTAGLTLNKQHTPVSVAASHPALNPLSFPLPMPLAAPLGRRGLKSFSHLQPGMLWRREEQTSGSAEL